MTTVPVYRLVVVIVVVVWRDGIVSCLSFRDLGRVALMTVLRIRAPFRGGRSPLLGLRSVVLCGLVLGRDAVHTEYLGGYLGKYICGMYAGLPGYRES